MKQKEKIELSLGEVVTLIIVTILLISGILTFLGPEIPDWIRGSNNYIDVIPSFWKYMVTILWCIDRIICIFVIGLVTTIIVYTIIWALRVFMISLYNLISRIVTRLSYKEIPKFGELFDKKFFAWKILFYALLIVTLILEIILHVHIAIYSLITVVIIVLLAIIFGQD